MNLGLWSCSQCCVDSEVIVLSSMSLSPVLVFGLVFDLSSLLFGT